MITESQQWVNHVQWLSKYNNGLNHMQWRPNHNNELNHVQWRRNHNNGISIMSWIYLPHIPRNQYRQTCTKNMFSLTKIYVRSVAEYPLVWTDRWCGRTNNEIFHLFLEATGSNHHGTLDTRYPTPSNGLSNLYSTVINVSYPKVIRTEVWGNEDHGFDNFSWVMLDWFAFLLRTVVWRFDIPQQMGCTTGAHKMSDLNDYSSLQSM
jgi:hypothetical protein